MRRLGIAGMALALAAAPPAFAGQGLLQDRSAASAAEFVRLFSEICVGLLPRYEGSERVLEAAGFAEPDPMGTRVHDRRALVIRVDSNEDEPPPTGPGCMLIGEGVTLEEAAPLLSDSLAGRVGDVESLSVEAVGLPHRIWLWSTEEGRAEVIASTDDVGRLVIGLGIRRIGGPS